MLLFEIKVLKKKIFLSQFVHVDVLVYFRFIRMRDFDKYNIYYQFNIRDFKLAQGKGAHKVYPAKQEDEQIDHHSCGL